MILAFGSAHLELGTGERQVRRVGSTSRGTISSERKADARESPRHEGSAAPAVRLELLGRALVRSGA